MLTLSFPLTASLSVSLHRLTRPWQAGTELPTVRALLACLLVYLLARCTMHSI